MICGEIYVTKMKKETKFQVAQLKLLDEDAIEQVFVKESTDLFGKKREILTTNEINKVLNEQAQSLFLLKDVSKRNQSLEDRVTELRKKVEYLEEHQSDDHLIKEVCKIIQDRIDYTCGEPIHVDVSNHLEAIKKDLIEKDLWRK